MFLDEQLIKICEGADISSPEDVQCLNRLVCDVCQDYYKSKLTPEQTNREIKALLDRTFNLFDSFVRLALAHESKRVNILGMLFSEYTFKKQLLENPEIAKVYNRL